MKPYVKSVEKLILILLSGNQWESLFQQSTHKLSLSWTLSKILSLMKLFEAVGWRQERSRIRWKDGVLFRLTIGNSTWSTTIWREIWLVGEAYCRTPRTLWVSRVQLTHSLTFYFEPLSLNISKNPGVWKNWEIVINMVFVAFKKKNILTILTYWSATWRKFKRLSTPICYLPTMYCEILIKAWHILQSFHETRLKLF